VEADTPYQNGRVPPDIIHRQSHQFICLDLIVKMMMMAHADRCLVQALLLVNAAQATAATKV
jgi:hypothetical protein